MQLSSKLAEHTRLEIWAFMVKWQNTCITENGNPKENGKNLCNLVNCFFKLKFSTVHNQNVCVGVGGNCFQNFDL